MAVVMPDQDGLAQQHNGATRLLFKVAAGACFVIADEVVGGGALWAYELEIKQSVKAGIRQLADRVMASAQCGDDQLHG